MPEITLRATGNISQNKKREKATERPSAAEQREAKRGKHEGNGINRAESVARQSLQRKFTLIYPKANVSEVTPQEEPENDSHGNSTVRILPKSLRPLPTPEPSEEMQILAKSGLRNSEVCNCRLYLKR